jgi:hypothetical protein
MPGVEGRKLIAAITEHRHGKAFQPLERQAQVQDDLGPGTEHRDPCTA